MEPMLLLKTPQTEATLKLKHQILRKNKTRVYKAKENKQDHRTEKLRQAAEKASASEISVLTYHNIIAKDDLKEKNFKDDGTIAGTVVTLENFKDQMEVFTRKRVLHVRS